MTLVPRDETLPHRTLLAEMYRKETANMIIRIPRRKRGCRTLPRRSRAATRIFIGRCTDLSEAQCRFRSFRPALAEPPVRELQFPRLTW